MNGPLEWIAAIGVIIAAALIAADRGRKVTGWGFVLFVAVSLIWVFVGMTSRPPAYPVAAMNGLLFLINCWGVWQYLLNSKMRQEIEMTEQCAADAHEELEARDG